MSELLIEEADRVVLCPHCKMNFEVKKFFKLVQSGTDLESNGEYLRVKCSLCNKWHNKDIIFKYTSSKWNPRVEKPTVQVPGTNVKIRKRAKHDAVPYDIVTVLKEEERLREQNGNILSEDEKERVSQDL